jgi:molybdopterin-guanine dinucleotide biosynthesis protein A
MLTIVLQAGGSSSRMGKDKALMPFLGVPLVQRLQHRFQGLGTELLAITNHPDEYRFLGIPLYTDLLPGRGALGGLLTALEISTTEYVGLIAADMPFASPDLLAFLLKEIKATGADVVMPSSNFGPEPLHSIYNRQGCLPLVRRAIEDDLWRMNAWHDQARVRQINASLTTAASGSEYTFVNLNTREDFSEAEELARKLQL